jgi:hypothetical protein
LSGSAEAWRAANGLLYFAAEKLSFWDETKHAFVTEPGAFEVLVGSSSEDIRLRRRSSDDAGRGRTSGESSPVIKKILLVAAALVAGADRRGAVLYVHQLCFRLFR